MTAPAGGDLPTHLRAPPNRPSTWNGGVIMTDLLEFIQSCPGLHAAAVPQEGDERVNWRKSVPRAPRVRVRRHTCDCKAVVYELCQAGGLSFIRRLSRSDGKTVITESDWVPAPEAEHLWLKILMGTAR